MVDEKIRVRPLVLDMIREYFKRTRSGTRCEPEEMRRDNKEPWVHAKVRRVVHAGRKTLKRRTVRIRCLKPMNREYMNTRDAGVRVFVAGNRGRR